ncbi:helix-turn-helix domain-containing protein [Amycolatopsis sp. NBC_01480]|uniref:helix-turn-helix domain-containing protein n=1 Tax=Amycolatopsis sp. NBC_01480 TaxID=2903562 RepID=UPI002E2A8111|nr:XRE family transcriptional regulator [Amycolatopsis sp. NBC_01480]
MAQVDDVDLRVSGRLRELRGQRGLTLSALAGQTGISAPHLSRLEKGERQPSIGALLQLARVYGVSVSHLVEEHEEDDLSIVRAGDAPVHRGQDGRYTVLSGPRSTISVVRIELTPGKPTKVAEHVGEEWLHVEAGTVRLTVDGRKETLSAGDSVHFDSARSHRLSAAEGEPAVVLIASTAATMPMRHPVPR